MKSVWHSNNLDEIIQYLKEKNIINKEPPFCLNAKRYLYGKNEPVVGMFTRGAVLSAMQQYQ